MRNPIRMYCVVNARFPSKKAYGIHVAKMCEALLLQGVGLTLVTPRTRASRTLQDAKKFYDLRTDIPTVTLWCPDWYASGRSLFFISSLVFMMQSFFYLTLLRIQKKVDVVYTIDMDTFSFSHLPLCGVPVFAEMHSRKPRTILTEYFFRNAQGVIATNIEIQKELHATFLGHPNRVLVEPNGVDEGWFTSFPKGIARKELQISESARVALYVGRFYEWKGLEILPRAAETANTIDWYVVGGSEEEFKKIVRSTTLPKNLHIVGERAQGEIPTWLASADTLLILGTRNNETSYRFTAPMKVFEYMASSRPVVASATPALKSILNDEVVWYEPDNPKSLSQAVVSGIENDSRAMVERAHKGAKQHSWANRTARILKFITN